ncbi:MAG: dockerin type I domain-containing protein [Candidatus Kapaibacteriales bacterium]
MGRIFISKILLLLIVQSLNGQSIVLKRGDVDSSRSRFVTATFNFKLIIELDSVYKCTSASFALWHNISNYVIFTNYRIFEFSRQGSTFVYPYTNYSQGVEYLYVGLLSGDTIGGDGFDLPKLIELEFTVLPEAPNDEIVTFGIEGAEAVVSTDSGGRIITLKSQVYNFTIHSFVEVWPGDANNDGKVGLEDVSRVGLYLGYGSKKPNFRSFKRPEASTKWIGQKSLAWDSSVVTFADCDGDGEVTLNDFLVVSYNFGKTKDSPRFDLENEINLISKNERYSSNNFIPLKVLATKEILAIAGEINLDHNERINFIHNENIESKTLFYVESKEKGFVFTIASLQNDVPLNEKAVSFLVGDINEIYFPIQINAITTSGEFCEAYLIPDRVLAVSFSTESSFDFENISFPIQIKIFSLIGKEVFSGKIHSSNEFYRIFQNLRNGRYVFSIFDGVNCKSYKILKD